MRKDDVPSAPVVKLAWALHGGLNEYQALNRAQEVYLSQLFLMAWQQLLKPNQPITCDVDRQFEETHFVCTVIESVSFRRSLGTALADRRTA